MKKRIDIISLLIGSLLAWLIGIGPAWSDDTEIFGSPAIELEPNVLIIFDSSGSMKNQDIPGYKSYDPNEDYHVDNLSLQRDHIYRWSNSDNNWKMVFQGINVLETPSCDDVREELKANGTAFVTYNPLSPWDCIETTEEQPPVGYEHNELFMGNYIYYKTGKYDEVITMMRRTDVAKKVVKQLIDDHQNVRYGIMRFNGNDGGKFPENGEIKDYSVTRADELKAIVDNLPATGNTPLAETLAEAGLYFAGKESWFHKDLEYTSPIDIKCRPNYVILMTDGYSTDDNSNKLRDNPYIDGNTKIGDFDGDGKERYNHKKNEDKGSDYLDDVAKFLYDKDLRADLGTKGDTYEKQNVITYTIGFKHTDQLLKDTAKNGGGEFYTADNAESLGVAFTEIIGTIDDGSKIYTTPAVPVSRANGVYAGKALYIGLFKPDMKTGNWLGNLKKYKLNDAFDYLKDADNKKATDDDGKFLETSRSYWSSSADGIQVDAGGAGSVLSKARSRRLYTYLAGDNADSDLTEKRNRFHTKNKKLTKEILRAKDSKHREKIIKNIYGREKEWPMGDVLHSEPQVVPYGKKDKDGSVIYVGTNGGVMHCFWDRGTKVKELWGFIPPGQLDRVKMLLEDSNSHKYFVDGPPNVFEVAGTRGTKKYLAFGERRGGNNYYVLDITKPKRPEWKYQIDEDFLGSGKEPLGQSWGRPRLVKIATGDTTTPSREVLLLPGGYDDNQDNETITSKDTRGRAVFTVTATGGELWTKFSFYNDETTSTNTDMEYSIVDVIGADTSGDGLTNSIYAPDLGGNMFAFTDGDKNGTWVKYRLFDTSSTEADQSITRRKIFYAPDIIRITGDPNPKDDNDERKSGEMIFFGTGDRAHPLRTDVENRFYAVKNYWKSKDSFTTMKESDLHDATDNHIVQGTSKQKKDARNELEKRLGWFIKLKHTGEKVTGPPVVFNGVVYFTTYTPPASGGKSSSGSDSSSDCDGNDVEYGKARLYGLSYKDGRAVHDWSEVKEYDPEDPNKEIENGGKADRWKELPNGTLPSSPVILVHKGAAKLYVGAGDELLIEDPIPSVEMKMYYWRDTQTKN